jgi:peptidoglycan-N-acetylglucosamine deacetylase
MKRFLRWNNRRHAAIVAGLLLIVGACARWNGLPLPAYYAAYRSGRIVSSVSSDEKIIALTFDDGPDARFTPRILDILHTQGAKATFFVEGRAVLSAPALLKREIAEGHQIGNHTFSHPYLERLSSAGVQRELAGCEDALMAAANLKVELFRPPRGHLSPAILTAAAHHNLHIILWSASLEHEAQPRPEEMAAEVMKHVRPGGIILMHDGGAATRESTVRALPMLLSSLKAEGYRFVTVPELLKNNSPRNTHP